VLPDSRYAAGGNAGKDPSNAAKVQLWKPFIAPSLKALHEENKKTGRSFGIIKPDPAT